MSREKEVLLSVKHLKKYFNVGRGSVLKELEKGTKELRGFAPP